MTNRPKIPTAVEAKILLASKRRCCLCFGLHGQLDDKKGQIAHIDEDPWNNDPDNLAFVCFDHHDQYDTSTSQSKGLTAAEVKRYRDQLVATLAGGVPPTPDPRAAGVFVAPGAVQVTGANTIHLGPNAVNIVAAASAPHATLAMQRTFVRVRPLASPGALIGYALLMIALGMGGWLAAINIHRNSSLWWLPVPFALIAICGTATGGAVAAVKRRGFSPFATPWLHLELGADKRVYLTRLSATCPRCAGSMFIRGIRENERSPNELFFVCERNEKHRAEFDPTTRPPIR